LLDVPIGGNDGRAWNHLHAEREDVCEALVKNAESLLEEGVTSGNGATTWHLALLQWRLKEIDDALDRLMVRS